jgi:hypothetical protein
MPPVPCSTLRLHRGIGSRPYEAISQASTCVNEQWRLVFRWEDNSARDVRLLDYHK